MRLLLMNVAVTVGLLLAIEGVVRLAVPGITPAGTDRRLVADSVYGAVPGLRPGAEGLSNGAAFRVDERGFWRYASDAAAADTARGAWLLLGDSVTMGLGVDPDATFAGLLAARVDTARVLNPSLIGYSSRDYRVLLEALTTEPHDVRRVTVFWCLNDVYAAVPGLSDPDRAIRRAGGAVLGFVRRHVYTYHWLKAALFDRPRTYFEHDRRLYDGVPLEAAVDDLRRMQRLAEARGLRFEVVLLPYEYQLRSGAPDAFRPQAVLRERLRAASIPVYDAAPFLRSRAAESDALYLYGDGIHLSARGHALVAAFVETNLRP